MQTIEIGITISITMAVDKFAISVERELLKKVDQLIKEGVFPNRSQAIQMALKEKLERHDRVRLAAECAKLDKKSEQAMADEDLDQELGEWPEY